MKYFAYGSNMDVQQMEEREVCFTGRKKAVLEGYALKFNKIASGKEAKEGEGKGNVVTDPQGITEGALYEMTEAGLRKLDGNEKGYDRVKLGVRLDGSKVKAWVYVAQPDKVREGLRPRGKYLKHYLKGKDLLSSEYYQMLEKVETID